MALVRAELNRKVVKRHNKHEKDTYEEEEIRHARIDVERKEVITAEAEVLISEREVRRQRKRNYRLRVHGSKHKQAKESSTDRSPETARDHSSLSTTPKKNILQPKNFLVRVYANGDLSRCAYCASCSMNIILSEATRKLCLVRRAERLFDDNGCEIFKSEDILRDKDYYVSCGENYISSIRAVRRHLLYRKHTVWTINGIVITVMKRRHRRRLSSSEDSGRSSSSGSSISSFSSSSSDTSIYKRPKPRPKKKIRKIKRKKPRRKHRSVQTDEILPLPLPLPRPPKNLKLKSVSTQTDKELQSNSDAEFIQTSETDSSTSETEEEIELISKEDKHTQTKNEVPAPIPQIPAPKPDVRDKSTSVEQSFQRKTINKETQSVWNRFNKSTQTGDGGPDKFIPSSNPIYRRPNRTRNFRVKVFPNGDRSRYAYCKSCSMEILFLSATDRLQLVKRATRLFDSEGKEIFHSEEIRRDEEYYVSGGANFKMPPD